VRRAPRLAPEERIAPYLTRVGRFRRIDPTVGRAPSLTHVAAGVGWALLVVESLRRARRGVSGGAGPPVSRGVSGGAGPPVSRGVSGGAGPPVSRGAAGGAEP
jgi:hypothetical protein